MKHKMLKLVLMVIVAALSLGAAPCTGAAGPVSDQPDHLQYSFAFPSKSPAPYTLDFDVNIPDANLNSALHEICGVPEAEAIRFSDLAGISGSLDLSGHNIKNAEGIQYCQGIESLYLNDNNLEQLPTGFCDMSNLITLDLTHNNITSLPSEIGSMNIRRLYADYNLLTEIPDSIGESAHIDEFTVSFNRLEAVPVNFRDQSFILLDIEWNFINVSEGSANLEILDETTAKTKKFLHQLKPLIAWTWCDYDYIEVCFSNTDKPEAGHDGLYAWTPGNITVSFKRNDEYITRDIPPGMIVTAFEGFEPMTTYKFDVSIVYTVTGPGINSSNRYFQTVTGTTTMAPIVILTPTQGPKPTPTSPPTLTPAPVTPTPTKETDPPSATLTKGPGKSEVSETMSNEVQGIPAWAVIVLTAAALIIAGLVFTIIRHIKVAGKKQ